MNKQLYQTTVHYLILLIGLMIGLMILFSFPQLKVQAVIGLCVFYFLWGISHHLLEKDLHIKIVLEYLLVALIGAFILLSIIQRAQFR